MKGYALRGRSFVRLYERSRVRVPTQTRARGALTKDLRLSRLCRAINNLTFSRLPAITGLQGEGRDAVYRCVCHSIEGFVQQLAVAYVSRGFYFYATGVIKAPKDPATLDAKLIDRYGIDVSKWQRARRKRAGVANLQYLRHERFFVIIATHGTHRFFDEEQVRDIREAPIKFHGYSIGCGKGADGRWHASVRIHADEYLNLKAHFLDLATHRTAEQLAGEFRHIRFAPFARVRRQLLNLLRAVNRARAVAGLEELPMTCLRLRRKPVKVFAQGGLDAGA